jgi:hypothetical protein
LRADEVIYHKSVKQNNANNKKAQRSTLHSLPSKKRCKLIGETHQNSQYLQSMSIVPKRSLGSQGLVASAQGLGCMVSFRTVAAPHRELSFTGVFLR